MPRCSRWKAVALGVSSRWCCHPTGNPTLPPSQERPQCFTVTHEGTPGLEHEVVKYSVPCCCIAYLATLLLVTRNPWSRARGGQARPIHHPLALPCRQPRESICYRLSFPCFSFAWVQFPLPCCQPRAEVACRGRPGCYALFAAQARRIAQDPSVS